MTEQHFDIIAIGGSSGSIGIVSDIINALPAGFAIPVVIIIHRRKNVVSELKDTLSATHIIYEPEDKEPICNGRIYLAPQNYHLLTEQDNTFSLDYSEPIHFSRPSIDVTFSCIADVYKHRALGIILSGANADGADGLNDIIARGGLAIAQLPATAEYPSMPEAAIKKNPSIKIHDPQNIVDFLLSLHKPHTHL